MPDNSSRAYTFALKTWDNVYSVYHWTENIWRVQLFSATGPVKWIVFEGKVPKIGKASPSFV